MIYRSSQQRCSVKKGVLEACNFIKKDTLAQAFYFEFYEMFKNIFYTKYLWTTASGYSGKV